MRVIATQTGFHGLTRRYAAEEGRRAEVFEIEDHEFSENWMECVDEDVEDPVAVAKEARKKRAVELAEKAQKSKKKVAPPQAVAPLGKKKTAAQRAEAGEKVALSEIQGGSSLPTTDESVI